MATPQVKVTYIGGPTALLELDGLRLLIDPTFDPPGIEYKEAGMDSRLRWLEAGRETAIDM